MLYIHCDVHSNLHCNSERSCETYGTFCIYVGARFSLRCSVSQEITCFYDIPNLIYITNKKFVRIMSNYVADVLTVPYTGERLALTRSRHEITICSYRRFLCDKPHHFSHFDTPSFVYVNCFIRILLEFSLSFEV